MINNGSAIVQEGKNVTISKLNKLDQSRIRFKFCYPTTCVRGIYICWCCETSSGLIECRKSRAACPRNCHWSCAFIDTICVSIDVVTIDYSFMLYVSLIWKIYFERIELQYNLNLKIMLINIRVWVKWSKNYLSSILISFPFEFFYLDLKIRCIW